MKMTLKVGFLALLFSASAHAELPNLFNKARDLVTGAVSKQSAPAEQQNFGADIVGTSPGQPAQASQNGPGYFSKQQFFEDVRRGEMADYGKIANYGVYPSKQLVYAIGVILEKEYGTPIPNWDGKNRFAGGSSQATCDNTLLKQDSHPLNVSGELFLPQNMSGPVPAMVVIHGTGGKDDRTEYFAKELPKHGIAAFVVDYKTGVFRTPTDRPPNDSFIPATYAALKLLESRSEVIPEKIGVMGFSLGGQQTMSATLPVFKTMWMGDSAPGFRLHVAFYPGCKFYARKLDSLTHIAVPIQVFWGTDDAYGDGEYCPKLKQQLATISTVELDFVAFQGGHHGFDGYKIGHFADPAAIKSDGYIQGNSTFRNQARQQALEFIDKYMK